MWIMLSDVFLSVVADKDDFDFLMVRARVKGDIERVFPGAVVSKTPAPADYAYRVSLPRETVAKAVRGEVLSVNYFNFKNSVPTTKRGNNRHDAYLKCWAAMMTLQTKLATKPRRSKDDAQRAV